MGEILAEYSSHSKPGTSHNIVLGRDGVVYCTCWAWKINKRCKHLMRFFNEAGRPRVGIPVAMKVQASTPSTIKTAKDLISSIDVKFWNQEGGSNENNKAGGD